MMKEKQSAMIHTGTVIAHGIPKKQKLTTGDDIFANAPKVYPMPIDDLLIIQTKQ
jgi:hypothetical protein